GWQSLPRIPAPDFETFALGRRPFILPVEAVQSFGWRNERWSELSYFENHPQVLAMERLFDTQTFRPIALRCGFRAGADKSGMSCPMTPKEALSTLRRRSELGPLADDGLAMYIGAWEYDADDWTAGGGDWSAGLSADLKPGVPFAKCMLKEELGEHHELPRSMRWIYIGEPGSGTCAHCDPLCSHGWMWLAAGRKDWRLVHFEAASHTQRCEAVPEGAPEDLFSNGSCNNLAQWLQSLGASHEAWFGTLLPGELIFVPAGVLHAVQNIGPGVSIAVSQNFMDASCAEDVLRCLEQTLQMLQDLQARPRCLGALGAAPGTASAALGAGGRGLLRWRRVWFGFRSQ
ncbi:unnamed protein product, partial [Effrenium voratum]